MSRRKTWNQFCSCFYIFLPTYKWMCNWPFNSGHYSIPVVTWSQSRHLDAQFKITTLQGVVVMWLQFATSPTGFHTYKINEKANRESHNSLQYVPPVFPGLHCALHPLAFLCLCYSALSSPQSTFAHIALHPTLHSLPALTIMWHNSFPPLTSLNSCMAYIKPPRASQLSLLQHPGIPYLGLPSLLACWISITKWCSHVTITHHGCID